jgi:D-serine deaminase-like pyridoxal phosphate-dependent protein
MDSRGPNAALIGVPGSRHALDTPALVLDIDVMQANIDSMAAYARDHGFQLRPVAKIHKSVDVARLQVAAGANGVTCATLAECEAMTDGGVPGCLLFTSVVSAQKLARLAALNARAEDLIVVADNPGNLLQLAETGRASGRPLQVLVDIEVGGRRTGIAGDERILEFAKRVAETDGLLYAGVQAYVGDYQNTVDYDARRARSRELLAPLVPLVERLKDEGLAPRIVSGGGTGTHDFDHELGVLTEFQVGSYVFMDVNYRDVVMRKRDPHPFGFALSVRTTVVSAEQPGFVITDAGMKELDAMLGLKYPAILRGAPDGAKYALAGDDMGRIEFTDASDRLAAGDVIDVLPAHCYATLNMYSHYHVVRGDELIDIWPIGARDNW